MSDAKLTRRDALRLGGAAGVATALPWMRPRRARAAAAPRTPAADGEARHIIFMIADGMSMGVPTLAEPFSRQVRGRGTRWAELLADRSVAHGLFDMASAQSLVTDSAAASSSWGSGHRVNNGAINITPDGRRPATITDIARRARRRVGLVTTTRITHATPAGFATHTPDRNDEDHIARQYLDRVDVLLGGGRRHFPAGLIERYRNAGYTFCDHRGPLGDAAHDDRLLGLFAEGHLPYSIDHRNSPDLRHRTPTLAEMTRSALDVLGSTSGGGFLLQVEGGRVDHAAHANDAAALLHDQLAFDDALDVALNFAMDRGDTLLIVTTDHGNANPGLNGMGSKYRNSNECFACIAAATASYAGIARQIPADRADPDRVQRLLGIDLSDEHAEIIANAALALKGGPAGASLPEMIHHQFRSPVGVIGQVLANYTGIGWTGTSHTADYTLLTAVGAGQERFTGLRRNTEAFTHLCRLMGVTAPAG